MGESSCSESIFPPMILKFGRGCLRKLLARDGAPIHKVEEW